MPPVQMFFISSAALQRKSMKSAALAARAPCECSSAGMIRSLSFCTVAYSCAVSAFGLYGPLAAAFSCATVSWTCCASADAIALSPAAIRAISARRESCPGLNIALPHLVRQIFRRPPGERHDAQRHVLVRLADHRGRVAHEQVPHLVRLAVAVEHRVLRILAHLDRARLVDDRAARRDRAR